MADLSVGLSPSASMKRSSSLVRKKLEKLREKRRRRRHDDPDPDRDPDNHKETEDIIDDNDSWTRSESDASGSVVDEEPNDTPIIGFRKTSMKATPPSATTSVFSSMFQNAANTFSSLTSSAPRVVPEVNDSPPESEPRAVATLGRGELSLSSILESTPAPAVEVEPEPEPDHLEAPETRKSVSRRRGSSVSSPVTPPPPIPSAAAGNFTGFALASRKRNREFHNLFRSVPEDDHLIEDYGCALSREILLQGRLYISEQNICFNSNIFGWVTNLVISFDEVMAIEKKTTAGLFPNAIVIQTLHARNVFASFISRDSTYELMYQIWRNGDQMSSDKDSDDDTVEEEEEEEGQNPVEVETEGGQHAPTQCACTDHLEKVVCDMTFPVPISRIYNLLWGEDTTWIENFMTNTLKVLELTKPTAFAETENGKQRSFNYIKPLYASMGPKQTKCLATETVEHQDDDYITVVVSTITPDVPSGSMFVTKTKYCLTWAQNNQTHLLITCGVEWSGKSWIKGPIEKGANDGQQQSANSLVGALEAEFQPKEKKKRRKKTEPPPEVVQPAEPAIAYTDSTYITYVVIALFACVLISVVYLIFRPTHEDTISRYNVLWDFEERRFWEWLDEKTSVKAASYKPGSHTGNWLARYELDDAIQVTQKRLDLLRQKAAGN